MEFDTFSFFFSIKTLFRHSCLDHTRRYKIKMLMVKTLPFASLISEFSSLLGVASLTSWFQFMSSPLLSLSLFFFPAGMPFPPGVLHVLLATQPPSLARRSFLLRLPPLPLGNSPLGRPGPKRGRWGTGQESCLRSVYQAANASPEPCPRSAKLPGNVRVITSPRRLGAGSGRASPPPAPGAPPPAVLAQPGHESPRRELRGAAGVPRPRVPRLGGKL